DVRVPLGRLPARIGEPVCREIETVLDRHEQVQDHDLARRAVGAERLGRWGKDVADAGGRVSHRYDLGGEQSLSTTSGGAQHAGRAELLDRLEVEVVEDRARLPLDQRVTVALDDDAAVSEDPVRERRWRLVEQHQTDWVTHRGFQARCETT